MSSCSNEKLLVRALEFTKFLLLYVQTIVHKYHLHLLQDKVTLERTSESPSWSTRRGRRGLINLYCVLLIELVVNEMCLQFSCCSSKRISILKDSPAFVNLKKKQEAPLIFVGIVGNLIEGAVFCSSLPLVHQRLICGFFFLFVATGSIKRV